MPGAVIGKVLNLGYAGGVSRGDDTIITNRVLKAGSNNVAFGDAVILQADNTWGSITGASTAAEFAGVAVREVKQSVNYLAQATSAGYVGNDPTDVIERGSVTVFCNNGTPTAGGAVFLRILANVAIPNGKVGQFEAVADGTNTIEITNAKWKTGKLDANKIAELTILTRNMP
ncbi:hypothetical protein SAMN04487969_102508 [Paenibacillus algorifonticola]|uniref:Uncharacterized protein n=1 Tax=Paenibacillus algorifonticola TaxID=684063 RepID=A0A1I2AIC1_9BACL|nr:hypothetical protein [Paenibacillus algorifonticola]SFE43656.1 hypothetical protein SAMN04487969_102508 [Paenibacillus algorifonticola]